MSKRRKYAAKFKSKVVKEVLKEQKTQFHLSLEYKISPSQIAKWINQVLNNLHTLFENNSKKSKDPDIDIETLYSQIGKL